MRPSPSIEPFTPSPDISLPHPVLRAVLDNLDVQLEEELVRYRRQRRLQSDKYQSKFSSDSANPLTTQSRSFTVGGAALGNRPIARRAQIGLDLPKFNISPDGEFPIGNSADTENPVKSILGGSIAPQRAASSFSRSTVQSGQSDRVPFAKMPSVKMPPFSPAEPAVPATAYQPEPYQPSPSSQLPEAQPLAAAIGITSYAQQPELSAYAPSATLQRLAHEQFDNTLPDPEGYLESSEELLKSIEEEMPLRARRRADLLDLLLTPLGVGLMLLLLLSTATLGFLIMNPGTLSALFSPSSKVAASPSSPSNPLNSPLTRVPTTPIDSAPPSPDLSAEEFRDVNLNTLSTLPSGSSAAAAQRSAQQRDRSNEHSVAQSSTQSGSQAPTQSGGNAAPASTPQPNLPTVPVQAQPTQSQPAQSAPAYSPPTYTQPPYSPPAYTPPAYNPPPYNPSSSPSTSPSSSPAASPSPTGSPAVPTQASPSASRPIDVPPPDSASSNIATAPPSSASATQSSATQDYYYVGTDYSGDSSLQEARQTVPDAYVRNLPSGGAIVQAGAFSSKSAAAERVQELQQQGLPAQIYRH